MRGAAGRSAAVNERFLRRISAELHDGPAQDLSLALLRLDHVAARCAAKDDAPQADADLRVIDSSLQRALREMRSISAGLGLPQLGDLSLAETAYAVVRMHERRTGTRVEFRLDDLPEQAPLPVKITVYRVIQEALTNAYRHAGGVGQVVSVRSSAGRLCVEISDSGPGFSVAQPHLQAEHLGLIGMRERVESLGGVLRVHSSPGRGATIAAELSVEAGEDAGAG